VLETTKVKLFIAHEFVMSNHKTHKSYETLQLDKPGWRTQVEGPDKNWKHLLKLYTKFLEEPGITLGFQTSYVLHV